MKLVWMLLGLWVCVLDVLAQPKPLNLEEGQVCKDVNGTLWSCKKLGDCPKAQDDINIRRIRPALCSFKDGDAVVCCDPDIKNVVGEKARQMCRTYVDAVFVTVPEGGLVKSDDEIATKRADTCYKLLLEQKTIGSNGENAKVREFPHMALIGYGNQSSVVWFCGGSLISDRFVLSAAHCSDSGKIDAARWVRLGDYNFRSKEDEKNGQSNSVEYEIVERINHPNYHSSKYYNDIALYKLNASVEFNGFIRPLCLHTEDWTPDGEYTATGWGVLEWGGHQSDILQVMKMFISSRQECSAAFRNSVGNRLSAGIDHETMMCAGDVKRGVDTCPGDSGGPLQVAHPDLYCMYLQVGITSFGSMCGGNRPGVYTRVSHFIPWIESVVWP